MAQVQQGLSIEIAQAQSRLAEDTRKDEEISIDFSGACKGLAEDAKRDGTSMETLAVMTLVYLPSRAVSSILGMPLFDWSAKGAGVIDSRNWVLFVLAVPLTALTGYMQVALVVGSAKTRGKKSRHPLSIMHSVQRLEDRDICRTANPSVFVKLRKRVHEHWVNMGCAFDR